jgi:hypothetical protein
MKFPVDWTVGRNSAAYCAALYGTETKGGIRFAIPPTRFACTGASNFPV